MAQRSGRDGETAGGPGDGPAGGTLPVRLLPDGLDPGAYQRAEERARRLTTLSTLTRLINTARGSREVFDAVARAAATLLGAKIAHVWVDDPAERLLRMEGSFGLDPDARPAPGDVTLPHGRGVAGAVFESRAPEYVLDVQRCPRWTNQRTAREVGLHAAAEIPLITGDRIVGVLSFLFDDCREFTLEEKELMGLLADQAAIAINDKRAEEDLRRAHGETERLLASISWILIAVDERDRVTRWNAAAERTFRIAADVVVGRPLLTSGIRWDWRPVLKRIAECRETGQPTKLEEVSYRRRAARDGFLNLTVTPIAGDGRSHAAFLILGADITRPKLLQLELAQGQKLKSIGRLAAGVAHEINTPIQFVGDNSRFLKQAFADLFELLTAYQAFRDAVATGAPVAEGLAALRRAEDAADVAYLMDEVPKAITQTLDGVGHVASIVRALRVFAHPDRGEPVLADLNQALLTTLTVARNEIKYVADVETELAELPPVRCHPGELNQVFLNLIVNAAHAIAEVVGASGRRGRIRVRTAREGAAALVAISDTGPGIPKPIQPRIFDPFFTTKPLGRGTGQGLAIAHAVVVERHGGTLTFETEPAQGTTFFVRLPIDGPPPARDGRAA